MRNLGSRGLKTLDCEPSGQDYDFALCDLPKQKLEAQYCLAGAAASLAPGGFLVAAAANDAGGKRLEDWFRALGLIPQSLSKHKCRVGLGRKNKA